MSKIRTGTELQQWLEEQRLKFQRKKEIEKRIQKKEKAEKKEARKKREEKEQKQKAKEEKKQQREEEILQHSIYVQNRTIQIYRTNGRRSKFSSEDDLFNTWEEIRYAEDKENGRINWERLPLLIEETRKLINGESKSRKRKPSI